MGNAATITAVLELQRGNFKSEQEKTTRELGQLQNTFRDAGAAVAVLERQLKSDAGNKALAQQVGQAKKEFRELGREIKLLETQKAALDKAMGGGGGPQLAGDKRVRKGSLGVVGSLLGGGDDPVQMITGAVSSAAMTMRMGLGSMLGIGIGVALVNGIDKAIAKAHELEATIKKAMTAGSTTGSKFSTDEQNYGAIGELSGGIEAASGGKVNGYDKLWRGMRNAGRWFKGEKSVGEETDDQIGAMDQQRSNLSEQIATHKAKEVELAKRARTEGEAAVAADREKLRYEEEIGKVQEAVTKGLDGTAAAKILASLKEEHNLRLQNLALARELKSIEENVRHGNAQDRANGTATAVSKAERELEAAQKKRDALPKGTPEWHAADDDLTNRQSDVRDAKRESAEKVQAQVDAIKLAQMTGPEFEKQHQDLLRKGIALTKARTPGEETYDPSKEAENFQKQAENDAALHAWDRANQQRGFQRRRQDIVAGTGLGPKEKLRSINELLGVNADEKKDNAANEKDVDRTSRLNKETAELRQQKKDIEYSSERELASSKAITQEMESRASGHQNEANLTAIRAQYEEKIAGYLREGKGDLAAQAQLQQNMAIQAAKLANFRDDPNGLKARAQARADDHDTATMQAREARKSEEERQRYEDENRATLPTDPAKREAAINAVFQPDRRAVANADPQQQQSKDDSNTGDVVDVLENIHDLLDSRLKLTIP